MKSHLLQLTGGALAAYHVGRVDTAVLLRTSRRPYPLGALSGFGPLPGG
jgi:hypothetical protein